MSEKELNYWFKIFVKNPYCFLSGEGKRLSFVKVFKLLKELYRENQKLKKQNNNFKTSLDEGQEIITDYIKENKELKHWKELHSCSILAKQNIELFNQQKDFIKYLEEEKDRLASVCSSICEDKFDEADDILQKYKEIIGDDK